MGTDTKILTVGKYAPARGGKHRTPNAERRTPNVPAAPRLFIPTLTGARERVKLAEWYWKEIKEGGFLCEYLADEKRRTPAAIRRVARVMSGFQQNNKSDFRRIATIPARLVHRWKAEDAHFFDDDNNLRSLKRDNPDLPIYVGAKRVKGTRFKYGEHRTSNIERRTSNGEGRRRSQTAATSP